MWSVIFLPLSILSIYILLYGCLVLFLSQYLTTQILRQEAGGLFVCTVYALSFPRLSAHTQEAEQDPWADEDSEARREMKGKEVRGRGRYGEKKKKTVEDEEFDDEHDEHKEDRESSLEDRVSSLSSEIMGVMNGKRRKDKSYREGMHACLLCLLNKEISLAGSSVFITFLRT